MRKNENFVMVGIQPWHIKIGSNFKNIAQEISKTNRVIYVNMPLSLKAKLQISFKSLFTLSSKKITRIQEVSNNLIVYTPPFVSISINWLPNGKLYNYLNRVNAKLYSYPLKKKLQELGITNYILINDSLMFIGKYLNEYLTPDFYLYYIRDNLVEQPYFNKHGKLYEALTIGSVDAVAANSEFLAKYAKQYNPHSYMVGQGCELSHFDESVRVIDKNLYFEKLKGPVIGYVGNLTSTRLDVSLLEQIAIQKPEWQFVLVGPEDDAFKASILQKLANVHFMGIQPVEDLPSWIKGFDVCLNPQLINSNTIGNYPRKVDEYLAMGKPVVATKTPAMNYFRSYVYLCDGVQNYIENISKALDNNSTELKLSRKNFASKHSWAANVKTIFSVLHQAN